MMELKEEAVTSAGGKKKKLKKPKSNKTQSLNDFLADASIGSKYSSKDPPKRTDSWADAMDERGDAEEVSTTWQGDFDRSQLPSAPRKAQARNIDRSRLPKAPPYTVYLGNLSYECTVDDIVLFFERKNLNVKEVRLPTDSGTSRLKGFGYAELENVGALLDALELTGEMLRNRSVAIDLATSKSADGDGGRDRYMRDSEDRTASDWRRGSRDDAYSPPGFHDGPNSFGDRYERGRGYGDDSRGGGGGYANRRSYDQGRGGFDRGGGYDQGRGGFDRGGGYDRGGGFDRGGGYDRGGGRGGYEGRGRRGYGSGGWNERPEYSRDYHQGDRYQDNDGGYGRRQEGRYDRDRRGPPRHNDDGYGRSGSPPVRPEPQERPRLQLQPRSKPADSAGSDSRSSIFGAAQPVDTTAREKEIEQKMMRDKEKAAKEKEKGQRERELREEKKESVFGAAKPVDTASREKEIEEKLRRRQEEDEKLLQRRQRNGSDGERKPRGRRESDRSWDGEEGGRGVHERFSTSPGREEDSRKEDGRLHDDNVRVREGRPKERQREERGRRERSIEEDWAEGERGVRRGQPPRGRVDSGDGEQGTERSQVVGRRGGGRGRGVGVGVRGRGREGERRDPRSGSDREQRRNKPPSSGEDGPVLRKYEEPQQPTFSQPSRYAMLEMEGDEAVPSAKDHQPQAKNN